MNFLLSFPRFFLFLLVMLGAQPGLNGAVAIMFSIGDIQGGSTQAGREGKIEALSYSWKISNGQDSSGEGQGLGLKAQQLEVSKYLDQATPFLLEACSLETIYPEAKLEIYESDPSTGAEKLTFSITMTDAVITSVQIADNKLNSQNLVRDSELLTLKFKDVNFDYLGIFKRDLTNVFNTP